MYTLIASVCSLAAGIGLTLAYQAYHNWARTPVLDVAQELKTDFNVVMEQFKEKHSLTEDQMGTLIYAEGFSGFRGPLFVKGSIALGSGYQIPLTGEGNRIWFNNKPGQRTPSETAVGPREHTQLVLIDPSQARILGTLNLPEYTPIADIEFLLFAPSELKQFRMNTVYGVKYQRATAAKE